MFSYLLTFSYVFLTPKFHFYKVTILYHSQMPLDGPWILLTHLLRSNASMPIYLET